MKETDLFVGRAAVDDEKHVEAGQAVDGKEEESDDHHQSYTARREENQERHI